MDPVTLHLRVNHFPIILVAVGFAAALVAALARREGAWHYAGVTLLLAGVTAPIAYWTGYRAEGTAEGLEMLADQGMMEVHEESAVWALVGLLACGLVAGLALRTKAAAARWAMLAVAAIALGATGYTAAQGGQIAHEKVTVPK